jgi:hypothetical protein
VIIKSSFRRKFLRTGKTRKHLVTIMPFHMGPQIVQRGERLAAMLKTTDKVLGHIVRALVALQLVAGDKSPGAARIVADEGLLVEVLHDVEAQLVALAVGFAASADRAAPILLPALHRYLAET